MIVYWLKQLLVYIKSWLQVMMGVPDPESLNATTDDPPITASFGHIEDPPITASLGPIDRLICRLRSLEGSSSKHTLSVGLNADQIRKLEEHLKEFRSPLKNLSEMDDYGFRAKWWMKEVRELCYDTEDYLEEFMRESGAGPLGRMVSIILYWIQSNLKCRPQFSQFMARAEVLKEISQNSLKEEIKAAAISLKKGNKTDTSFEKEIKADIEHLPTQLVDLLAFNDDKKIQLKVVAISGSAGIGKTKLARTLYVKNKMRFECCAFVWVSRNPDIMSLLTSILSQIKAPTPHGFLDMQDIIVSISTHLEGKRYFIVIDDVCRTTVWHIISCAFPDGQCGSRIIITTQSTHVALACSGYELESTIFQMDAVNSCTDSTPEEKNEVVNLRYNNLPLHLKTCLLYLGMYLEGCTITKDDLVKQWAAEGFIAALQRHRTEEISEVPQYETEKNSEVPRNKTDKISEAPRDQRNEIEKVPQDKRMERVEAPKKETEQIAGGYFDELVTRGLIQPVDRNHNGEVLSCTVHHMVLDLIRYKSKEDNFMVVVDNLESTIGHPDIVHRLSVQFGSEKGSNIPESIILSQVRSVAFYGFVGCLPSIAEYGLLRVLTLHIWADKNEIFDLTRIGELYHLRYLKIDSNIIVKLPGKIRRLRHLGTLQVDARLFAVPSDIVHLEKLLRLRLPSQSILPHGVGCMTSLRTLGYFDLGSNSEDNVRCLDELKNLQYLQLTCSAGEPAKNLEKSMQLLLVSVLQKLSILRSVTLAPASGSCNGNTQPDYGAVSSMSISSDGLSSVSPAPAHHLQRLELSRHCCIFSRLPKWLGELTQLCILKIAVRDLSKEDIDILKGLPVLSALSLHVASVFSEMIVIGKGGFSVLTYFKFTCIVPLLKFEADAMPNLQKLRLGFNATVVDKQGIIIEHLSGIKEISVIIGCVGVGAGSTWLKAVTNDARNPKVQWLGSIYVGDKGTGHVVTQEEDQEICRIQDMVLGGSEIMDETYGVQDEGSEAGENSEYADTNDPRKQMVHGMLLQRMGQKVPVWFFTPMTVLVRMLTPILSTVLAITVLGWLLSLIIRSVPLKQHYVATAGWAITVLGWLLSPIIAFLLPQILSCLGFDSHKKLLELEICIIPELKNTLHAIDQERMTHRGNKSNSDVSALEKMAAWLRHAREEAEDIFDDAQEKVIVRDILHGAVRAWITRFLGIARTVRSGSVRQPQRARNWSLRGSEEPSPVNISAAPSQKKNIPTTGDDHNRVPSIAAASSQVTVPVSTSAVESEEPFPVTTPSNSSGWWLSCSCNSFDLFKICCRSIFYWLIHAIEAACTYRDWSYEVVGITGDKDKATVLDLFLTAISRWKVKKRIKKVESTVSEVKKYLLLGTASKSARNDIADMNRSTIRAASKQKVFGREGLRDNIMTKLCETSSSSGTSPCYSVSGIYGVAGSGKTTFARYTRDYIEERKEKLFDTIMCIHVSETFSVDDIFHEMLKDITGDRHSNISDHEELEEKLKEELCGKRFFLILDDLWVKKKHDSQLGKLISPLIVGAEGSKILVTARTKDAAVTLCGDELIEMPDLAEDQYMKMFMHYALSGKSIAAVKEFEQVGREIAKKLHRSPIAAVRVAGRLGANPNISFWKYVAKFDMLNDTMDALWGSYEQLNPDIRRCFEFCNIFPRRFKLKKDQLVRLWIAQGFVKTNCATEEMEDVAEGYIQELISCSFLQPEVDYISEEYFTIHDLLHDLLAKVAGSDCLIIENTRSHTGQGWNEEVPLDVRHLFVQNYDGELITKKILGLENLRTLIIDVVDTPVEEKVIESICMRLPKLRVLDICFERRFRTPSYKFLVPESLIQLKHLRYLAFPSNCMVILPSTLAKLPHILLLDFGDGHISDFNSADLINLRHISCLDVSFPNIGRLSSLQTLPSFRVRNEEGYEIKQLRDLNKLRGKLEIYGLEHVKSKEEALEANLAAKERLTELILYFSGSNQRCTAEVEAEVLEGLCPPVGLEKLIIYGYNGSRYPDWMVGKLNGGPKDLQTLYFYRCGPLGPGPELEAFPHLRMLMLMRCSWDALPGNMEHLTSLETLQIEGCKNIRSLPTLPQSLKELVLCDCDDELMKGSQTEGDPNWHKIKHIPVKRFFPDINWSAPMWLSRKKRKKEGEVGQASQEGHA